MIPIHCDGHYSYYVSAALKVLDQLLTLLIWDIHVLTAMIYPQAMTSSFT